MCSLNAVRIKAALLSRGDFAECPHFTLAKSQDTQSFTDRPKWYLSTFSCFAKRKDLRWEPIAPAFAVTLIMWKSRFPHLNKQNTSGEDRVVGVPWTQKPLTTILRR